MAYLIGVDLGTSGTKTALFDERGRRIASRTVEYPLSQPKNGWAEQEPEHWWKAACETIRAVIAESGVDAGAIKGVGLSGQMHGLVMLDAAGQVLRPAILWCDGRTGEECREITERVGRQRLIDITANPALTGFTAGKILWVRKHEPENYERCRHILLPKDYLRYKLTGEFATEVSDASGMNLLDVPKRQWSQEILDALEMDRALLGRMYESCEVTGEVTAEAARLTGLKEGTPVAGGAGDNAAAAIGTGVARPGRAFVTLGTSGVIFAHSDKVTIDPKGRVHAFCAAVPGAWTAMSCTLSAGLPLQWFRNNFCSEECAEAERLGVDPHDVMTAEAAKSPVGANRLIYLPYLMGERSPLLDEQARGAFVGLSAMHTRGDLIRAVMEGVTYSQRQCLDILREMGAAPETVTACGGGARSAFWRQMLADALGCNIATSKLALEGPALGAAILAGVCAGVYDNVADAADSIVSIDGENSPEPAMSERLNKIYALGAGLLLLGAAGVLIGLMPQFMAVGSYALMLGFSLIAGVGYISIDLLMNSVIADVYKERKNGVLPYVHAFYRAGAMLAPVFVTALVSLERPESFARPYLILGLLSLTCAALMLLTGKRMKPQTPYADMEEIRGRARQNPAEIFREGSAWLFLLSGFMNLSFQTGLTTWLPRYCSLVWDYDLTAAGLMVTMYFMGALVMRLLSPFVYRKLGVKRYYQLTLLVSAALYLVFLLLPMPDWCRKAMVFALGLLQGATVPTLVILCCDAFPERTASASSVVVTGVSLASMVSPVVLGKLLTIDPQTAMLSITVCTVIAALALPKSKKA